MPPSHGYELVRLRGGAHSVRSLEHGETMHPGIGPVAEAEALYVRQLRLAERMREEPGEFVIWDIGLGAAANALTVLRVTKEVRAAVRLVSFDHTLEPLRFAYGERMALGYFAGFESAVAELLARGSAVLENGRQLVRWESRIADFPTLLEQPALRELPKPHVILFDPWSPSKNPAMWTAPVFAGLYGLLDLARPCTLATYSRSTMLRVSLLLAGFTVGVGRAAGSKEETTVAANAPGLITEPLDCRWLERAERSPAAEPLWEPRYRQAPLAEASRLKLRAHPQFQ